MFGPDDKNSILFEVGQGVLQEVNYSAYGHHAQGASLSAGLGYNGEFTERQTGVQILGDGYRAYSSVLMNFLSSDTQSPFDEGSWHSYAYCERNPIDYSDPTGQSIFSWIRSVFRGGAKARPTVAKPKINPPEKSNRAKTKAPVNGNKPNGFWDDLHQGKQMGDRRRVKSAPSAGKTNRGYPQANINENPPSGWELMTGKVKLTPHIPEPPSGLQRLNKRLGQPLIDPGIGRSFPSGMPNQPSAFNSTVKTLQGPSRLQEEAASVRRAAYKT